MSLSVSVRCDVLIASLCGSRCTSSFVDMMVRTLSMFSLLVVRKAMNGARILKSMRLAGALRLRLCIPCIISVTRVFSMRFMVTLLKKLVVNAVVVRLVENLFAAVVIMVNLKYMMFDVLPNSVLFESSDPRWCASAMLVFTVVMVVVLAGLSVVFRVNVVVSGTPGLVRRRVVL